MRPLLLIMMLLLQGCSTAMSKGAFDDYAQLGHAYTGVPLWLGGGGCGTASLVRDLGSGETSKTILSGVALPFVIVQLAIDLPLTLIADTVMLPFDLVSEPVEARRSIKSYCEDESRSDQNVESKKI